MITPQDDNMDAWTGMPLEVDEVTAAAINAQPNVSAQGKPAARFDIRGLFWKFLAAGSSDTPPAVLAVLAVDERVQIRRRTAENQSTPIDILALLAEDPVALVREAVARNGQTPIHVLRKLAEDVDVDVRFAIASNREMPDAILLSLFMDPDPFVAERASQTLSD